MNVVFLNHSMWDGSSLQIMVKKKNVRCMYDKGA